jgi:hypothetical protein
MVAPPKPWPRPEGTSESSDPEDILARIVARGDCTEARAYFDKGFWKEGHAPAPHWGHLKTALQREDRAMVRLLVTWGAKPAEEHLQELKAEGRGRFLHYMRILRGGGYYVPPAVLANLPDEPEPAASSAPPPKPAPVVFEAPPGFPESEGVVIKAFVGERLVNRHIGTIPAEWRRLLGGFQTEGAPEAVIAGGALRDLFNGRTVKDVDIFLRSRGSQRKNLKFLKKAFQAAGIEFPKNPVWTSGYGRQHGGDDKTLSPPEVREIVSSGDTVRKRQTLAFTVTTEPKEGAGTEYNIIFVEDNIDRAFAKKLKNAEASLVFGRGLIQVFDVGMCQIACDGKEIITTPEYVEDVKARRIVLRQPDFTTAEHLKRLSKKYPEWPLCRDSKIVINEAAETPRRGLRPVEKW